MDEDRRDNSNERVVVEKERNSSGPIVAIVAVIVLLILAFLAFQMLGNSEESTPVDVPNDVNINTDAGTN